MLFAFRFSWFRNFKLRVLTDTWYWNRLEITNQKSNNRMKLAKKSHIYVRSVFSSCSVGYSFSLAFPCYCIHTILTSLLHQFSFLSNSYNVVSRYNAYLKKFSVGFRFVGKRKKGSVRKKGAKPRNIVYYCLKAIEAKNWTNRLFRIVRFLNFWCFCPSAIFRCRLIHIRCSI